MSQLMKPWPLIFVKCSRDNVEFYKVTHFHGDLLPVYVWACMSQEAYLFHFQVVSSAQEYTHTDTFICAGSTGWGIFKQDRWKTKKIKFVSVSFPFLKDHSLSRAAEEVQGCIHQRNNIYLYFLWHVNLFNIKTFIYFVFSSHSSTRDSLLHFALISASLPPDLQVYTADGSLQSWRNVSGETAHTSAVESCDRGMLFMFNSLKV